MSFNGAGLFQINSSGNPVVTGTTISSTWANALTADLATGLSTCITKDGQTTVTANIPLGANKITGLAVGTASTDAINLSQLTQFGPPGYTTTATGATTTTLTVASTQLQYFTGSTTQIVALPVTSTLVLGFSFIIVNNSSGVVTVNSSGGNAVVAMVALSQVTVTCILTSGTSAASWNIEYTGHTAVTGTGSEVLSISPSLTTPTIGAATATSINFGQTALNYYQEGTWTPVDGSGASLSFTNVTGSYTRNGRLAQCGFFLSYPSTGNGANAVISQLPFATANLNAARQGFITYTSETTLKQLFPNINTTTLLPQTQTGGAITNATLSGDDICGTLLFPIS